MKSVSNIFKLVVASALVPFVSYAEEAHAAAAAGGSGAYTALAIGFGLAFAVIAASTAQGRIASSFMEGASRNPGAADVMKTPLLLSLIFVETLVLFTFLIVFMLMGKM